MKRNHFIKSLGLASLGASILMERTYANQLASDKVRLLQKIGVQLFSAPSLLEKDFEGTIALLAKMGYREVELFGPYPYSAKSQKGFWKPLNLGFSTGGYFGHSEDEVHQIFKDYGITVPSMHVDLETLENNMEDLGKASRVLGFDYVVLPTIPQERLKALDDYRAMADVFNKIGQRAKKEGLKFAYHNHGYGLNKIKGQVPIQLILDNTDKDLVFLEMDLFWTVAGGVDPIKYLEKYSGRYRMLHIKDMKEMKIFSGDGGDSSQWNELRPYMTSAGSGVLDLKSIISVAVKNGTEHFFVEQDLVKDPCIALTKSYDYLLSI